MALQDVLDQEKAVNILLRTIKRRRIPSAYLFAGESGVGKKFTAINLAKALNCLKRSNAPSVITNEIDNKDLLHITHQESQFDCCDVCSSCKKIDSGVHPDIHIISPTGGQIRIEEIRKIEETLSLKAFEGRWKVIIVEEAEAMNPFAANAFLKTLEEPPINSLIILITSVPDILPETILSRCSRVNFTPLSYEACKKVISQKSNPPLSPFDSRLSTIVRLSMGRPGLAVSTDLLEEREWFLKVLREMMKAEKDSWNSKEEMKKWLEYALIFFRDIIITKITKEVKDIINIDIKEYIKEFGNGIDLRVIIEHYQKLNALMGFFKFNLNKSLTWNYTASLLRVLKNVKI
ncbi:MAG: DNA polymerase III subunit delta' [Nitrospirae bacterium]|nr:DNA polymerase III subunit delta' [Nitrospirota bacterium]